MKNQVGLNLWTVYGWRPQETVTGEMLAAVGALGAEAVELVVDEAFNSEDLLLQRRPELQAALGKAGLQVPSVASSLFWQYNLASQDAALRHKGTDLIKGLCRVAKAYGAHAILIVAGLQEPGVEYDRSFETSVRTLRDVAPYAQDLGVVIGVEHVPANFLTTPREYAQYLTAVDHPSVQAYVDIGNAMGTFNGPPQNWVRAVKGHIAMVHVKDYSKMEGFGICGRGELDWSAALASLQEAGYQDALVVETPPEYGRKGQDIPAGLEAARASVSWLKSFLSEQAG